MANRHVQLTLAELLDRRVPLSASEAVALTLAVAQCGGAQAPDAEILLDSTGRVTCGARTAERHADESIYLAVLLRRLLRVEGADASERCGRIPGGLLVVLARMLRQIDLPSLSRDAFCSALGRFASPEPALLAAVFWRAARMRPRTRRGTGDVRASRSRAERRAQGPSQAELRRWLRQTECELFRLRQSRASIMTVAGIVALVSVALFGIGASFGDASGVGAPTPVASFPNSQTGPGAAALAPAPSNPPRTTADAQQRPVSPARTRSTATRTQVSRVPRRPPLSATVDMVNLPRSSWAVVRRLDTAASR